MARRLRLPPGSPPGTITVDPSAPAPELRVIAYDAEQLVDVEIENLEQIEALRSKYRVLWLDVQGLGDAATIEAIGQCFGLHRLALEDTVHVHQRAKVDVYDQTLFITLRMPDIAASPASALGTEQLSLFLGEGFVITFQEQPGDCFDPIRDRLRRGGRLRSRGPDYLVYALIDATVDSWFPVLDGFGETLEDLEDEILARPTRVVINRIHALRRDLLTLRRAVWPLRDALGVLYRDEGGLITADTRIYLRDCYDHAVQIIDLVENSRDIAAELTDVYLSNVSNRMNEVMKVLTIISTIFLPLSFIASLYGMNFDGSKSRFNMPELRWEYGYPFALGLMFVTVLLMLWFFRRRGWIGRGDDSGA